MKTFKELREAIDNWRRGDLLRIDIEGQPQILFTHIQGSTPTGLKDNEGNYWNEEGQLVKVGTTPELEKLADKSKAIAQIVDEKTVLKNYKLKMAQLLSKTPFNENDFEAFMKMVKVLDTIFSGQNEYKIFKQGEKL
jgi:hypothetical protein